MILKNTTTTEFEQLDDGMFPAVCVSVIGVGTQRTPFTNEDGTPKVQNKLILTWKTEGNIISKEYTASLHEKSNLRKDLESWRGKKFSEDELEQGFNIKDILGKPCTVQVMRNKNDYATVSAVLPKTKDISVDSDLLFYEVGEHDGDTFEKLPQWVKNKVTESIEWQEKPPTGYEKAKAQASKLKAKQINEEDIVVEDIPDEPINLDDIPF